MYWKEDTSQRWRKRLLIASYIILILAEGGEIFLNLNSKTKTKIERPEVEKRIEMPPHIPEESKIDFMRNIRVVSRQIQTTKIARG